MHLKRSLTAVRLFLVFLLLFWVTGCAGHLSKGAQPAPIPVTILFFNDLHGHLMPFEVKSGEGRLEVGGIARMAALIRDIRAENSRKHVHTLVLVAGDIMQGTPMSTVFRGEPELLIIYLFYYGGTQLLTGAARSTGTIGATDILNNLANPTRPD